MGQLVGGADKVGHFSGLARFWIVRRYAADDPFAGVNGCGGRPLVAAGSYVA